VSPVLKSFQVSVLKITNNIYMKLQNNRCPKTSNLTSYKSVSSYFQTGDTLAATPLYYSTKVSRSETTLIKYLEWSNKMPTAQQEFSSSVHISKRCS